MIDQIDANPLILYGLSCVATYYLSKGMQFIVQDLLASRGVSYLKVQEGLIFQWKFYPFRSLVVCAKQQSIPFMLLAKLYYSEKITFSIFYLI